MVEALQAGRVVQAERYIYNCIALGLIILLHHPRSRSQSGQYTGTVTNPILQEDYRTDDRAGTRKQVESDHDRDQDVVHITYSVSTLLNSIVIDCLSLFVSTLPKGFGNKMLCLCAGGQSTKEYDYPFCCTHIPSLSFRTDMLLHPPPFRGSYRLLFIRARTANLVEQPPSKPVLVLSKISKPIIEQVVKGISGIY